MFKLVYICIFFIQFSHASEVVLEYKNIFTNSKIKDFLDQKNNAGNENILEEKNYQQNNGLETHDYTIYNTDGDISYTSIGDTIYGSDGSTSTKLDNTTYKGNGETATQLGSTTYRSDGSTSTTIDNITIHSNGKTCGTINGTTICI